MTGKQELFLYLVQRSFRFGHHTLTIPLVTQLHISTLLQESMQIGSVSTDLGKSVPQDQNRFTIIVLWHIFHLRDGLNAAHSTLAQVAQGTDFGAISPALFRTVEPDFRS